MASETPEAKRLADLTARVIRQYEDGAAERAAAYAAYERRRGELARHWAGAYSLDTKAAD